MKTLSLFLIFGALAAGFTAADAAKTTRSVSLHDAVAGGAVEMSGSGTYDHGSGLLLVKGTFRCVRDVTAGPLAGFRAGDRGRWEGANVLPSVSILPSGAADATLGRAATDATTLAMQAEFRPDHASGERSLLRANVVFSTGDLDPVQPGVQSVWIEGVGCADALVAIR